MNTTRQEYEMTPADFEEIISRIQSAKNVPLIALNCGMPTSPQDAANAAWCELGRRMGFDGMTAQPTGKGKYSFTAVPLTEATP